MVQGGTNGPCNQASIAQKLFKSQSVACTKDSEISHLVLYLPYHMSCCHLHQANSSMHQNAKVIAEEGLATAARRSASRALAASAVQNGGAKTDTGQGNYGIVEHGQPLTKFHQI